MQKGTIRLNGRMWLLKIREDVTKDGVFTPNKIVYHGLVEAEGQFRPTRYRKTKSGNEIAVPPPAVQAMGNELAAKISAKRLNGIQATSMDSLKSYLASYVTAGIGLDGRPVSRITQRSWRRDLKMIADLLPDIQLRNVRTPDINRLFKALIATDGDDKRATTSYRNMRNFLSGAFRMAVGDGLVEFNPVRDAMRLTGNGPDTYAYSLAEMKKILDVVRLEDSSSGDTWKHTMRAAFTVAFFTGLRLEEVKGLKWEDYDKANQVLHIRRAVVEHHIGEPKTESSKAPMPVVKTLARELEAHLKRNSGGGFIFHKPSSVDSPFIPEHIILTKMYPACKAAGITFPIHIHACRRGLDTWMRANDVQDSLREAVLRHAPRTVADKHYGRRPMNKIREVLEKFETEYNETK